MFLLLDDVIVAFIDVIDERGFATLRTLDALYII
jgi:hypothetical protein